MFTHQHLAHEQIPTQDGELARLTHQQHSTALGNPRLRHRGCPNSFQAPSELRLIGAPENGALPPATVPTSQRYMLLALHIAHARSSGLSLEAGFSLL